MIPIETQDTIDLTDKINTNEVETTQKEPITEPAKPSLTFEELKTFEDVANYFGLEYSFGPFPQVPKGYEELVGADGRRYNVGKNENKTGKYHKLYDRENDCTIFIHQALTKPSSAKATKGKIFIDSTNTGKGIHNVKDIVKAYNDAPKILKQTNTSITFTNRTAKRLAAYNKLTDRKWIKNLSVNEGYIEKCTQGRETLGYIDMFKNGLTDTHKLGHSMQRTLYHEMAHGLDNYLSKVWSSRGRFSDKKGANDYGALIREQHIFDEKTGRSEWTSKEIVDGVSSEYGKRHWHNEYSYSEDFADCVSMVAFKNISDKSNAVILPPDWTWKNNLPQVTYNEFVQTYPHKVRFIEEVLGIDNK